MVRSKLFSALALAGLAVTSTAYGDLVIDDFVTPDGGQKVEDIVANGLDTWNATDGQPVLGGTRKIYADTTVGNSTTNGIKVEANGNGNEGTLVYDQFTSTYSGTGRVVYDGSLDKAVNTSGLGGIDLSAGGTLSSFLFESLVVTGSGLELTVNLYDATTGNVLTSGAQLLENTYIGDLLLDYADFTGDQSILANVGAIELLIDGTAVTGSDVTIGRLASTGFTPPPAVPEPSSMALAALASVGGLGYRWRKNKKAPAKA